MNKTEKNLGNLNTNASMLSVMISDDSQAILGLFILLGVMIIAQIIYNQRKNMNKTPSQFQLTPLSLFPPEKITELTKAPRLTLVFNQQGIFVVEKKSDDL